MLALINLAKRAANPTIDVLEANDDAKQSLLEDAPTGATTAPGLVVVRMAAPLFFANGAVFSSAVKRAVTGADQPVRHVVVDMEAVTDIDVTGAEAFDSLEQWLHDNDVTLAFSRVRPPTRARLEELGLLSDQAFFATNRAAVAALADRDGAPQD